MTLDMRTCTLTWIAALPGLSCGDDGRAEASSEPVTSQTDGTTPSEATDPIATTGAPPPTSSDGTTAATTPPDTEPTPTSGPSTAETGATTTPDPTTGGPAGTSTGGGPCMQGEIVCDGNTAQVCDGNGGFESEEPCAAVCAPGLGCVACLPGAGQCAGDVPQTCKDDGSGYVDGPACDPLQGLACDADAGACAGACAELDSLSYIGCDYYPVVTAQLDNFIDNNPFAVAVANTAATPANVTVTQADQTIDTVMVAAGSVELLILPWVDPLVLGNGPTTVAPDGAYRLRADQPVTVYQYNPLNADITNDALAA